MTSTIEKSETVKKIINTTFVLCGTKKSSWVKEGTGVGTNVPAKNLHNSKIMFIPMFSRLYLGKGNGYRETMYVIGSNTTYVDDYYEDSNGNLVLEPMTKELAEKKKYQFRPGLQSQGYDVKNTMDRWSAETRRAMGLSICFEDGRLELSKYGDDPVLLKFISEHEQNKVAPRAEENRDPSRLKLFMFEPLVRENKAAKAKIVESFDDSLEAMTFVAALRKKVANGYEYNELAMDAVLTILQDGIGLLAGEVNQKFEIILRAAKQDGKTFMDIINATMDDYKVEIGVAESVKILTYTATEAKLTKEGKMESIYTFKNGTEKESMVKELVIYFLSDAKGDNDFNEMKRYSEIAKIAALNAN